MTSFAKRFSTEISAIIKESNEAYGIREELDLSGLLPTTTLGVSADNIMEIQEIFGNIAITMKIIPLLRERHCHNNVNYLRRVIGGKHILGYNITGCPCGKEYSLELHSVLKFEGEYIDLTKDFCCEQYKWFIPVIEIEENDETFLEKLKTIREFKKSKCENIYSWRGTHNCDNSKCFVAYPEFNMKIKDAKEFIDYIFSKQFQIIFA